MKKLCLFIGVVAVSFLIPLSSTYALPVTHATLVSDNGKDIYDFEVKQMIDTFIGPNYDSMILAFTQCFGADLFDDFAGNSNTSLLSGSEPGRTSQYGGYHRGLAQSLAPGNTTLGAHLAGVGNQKPGDSPVFNGTNLNVGGINSTHVLVWAGDPNNLDQADINDIHNNFEGSPNTTVTVLAGNGTGANVDGAATFEDLRNELADIGSQMNEMEQFIFFVTDHGNLDSGETSVELTPGITTNVTIDMAAYDAMLLDPNNIPELSFFSSEPIDTSLIESIYLNGYDINNVFTDFILDYDMDNSPDAYQYNTSLEEYMINEFGNTISISYTGATSIDLDLLSLESGDISRTPVPEPASICTISFGLVCLEFVRRRRKLARGT